MNTCNLLGRLVKDPELKRTQNNKAYVNFTVAVSRFTRQGEKPQADFINCIAWEKTAEVIAQYFQKGSQIALEGSIQTGSYKNNQGQTVYTTNVLVSKIHFVGNKEEKQTQKEERSPYDYTEKETVVEEYEINNSDLPF